MKATKFILSFFLCILFLASCKKEVTSNEGVNPPKVKDLNNFKIIGSEGSDLNQFNFGSSNYDMPWMMATDGNYVYVGDYENYCVKKVDISSGQVVGWYGYKGSIWGYYTTATVLPDPTFKPYRLIYKDNKIYAFSHVYGISKSVIYEFDITSNSLISKTRTINEYTLYAVTMDDNKNIFVAKGNELIKYELNGTIKVFGGPGIEDGKLSTQGYTCQLLIDRDTLIVLDAGNSRIQKFNTNGDFLSSFPVNTNNNFWSFCIEDHKYYLMENSNLSEYTSNGMKSGMWIFLNSPQYFNTFGKQILKVKDKFVIQQSNFMRLVVY